MTPASQREIERCALFGLIRGTEQRAQIEQLSVEVFEHAPHRRLFLGVAQLVEDGEPVNDASAFRAAGGGAAVQRALAEITDPNVLRVPWPSKHIPALRELAAKRMLARVGSNGITGEDLRAVYARAGELLERAAEPATAAVGTDVFSVAPHPPTYHVRGLVPRGSFSLVWAKRGGYKSLLELSMKLSLLHPRLGGTLFGHPELIVDSGYERVLWLACEESAGDLHYRADRLIRGMGLEQPEPGRLIHLPARDGNGKPRTLEHVPDLVAGHRADCVVIDYLTGFRARHDEQGRRISHDLDNDEAHEATRPLRELAASGVDVRLIHHEGTVAGRARGASEYANAADVEVCFAEQKDGKVKVDVLKLKNGRRLDPFLLNVDWSDGGTRIEYAGAPRAEKLTPQEQRAWDYLAGAAGQPEHCTTAHLAAHLECDRSRASRVLKSLETKQRARKGEQIGKADTWEACEPMLGEVEL